MSKSRRSKIQYLLVKQLLEEGTVELILPHGMTVEIGITQTDRAGKSEKADDYCYVMASQEGKVVLMDSYNIGVQYEEKQDTIVVEDTRQSSDGRNIRMLDVI